MSTRDERGQYSPRTGEKRRRWLTVSVCRRKEMFSFSSFFPGKFRREVPGKFRSGQERPREAPAGPACSAVPTEPADLPAGAQEATGSNTETETPARGTAASLLSLHAFCSQLSLVRQKIRYENKISYPSFALHRNHN